jgi:hypothetical protein
MKTPRQQHTVRRSVALSATLVEDALAAVPEHGGNFNRVVVSALRELIEARKAQTLAAAMEQMARDPSIRAECAAIARDLASAELDGLGSEP